MMKYILLLLIAVATSSSYIAPSLAQDTSTPNTTPNPSAPTQSQNKPESTAESSDHEPVPAPSRANNDSKNSLPAPGRCDEK